MKQRIKKSLIFVYALFAVGIFFASASFAKANEKPTITLLVGDEYTESIPAAQYEQWITLSFSLSRDEEYDSEIEALSLCNNKDILCILFSPVRQERQWKRKVIFAIDEAAVSDFISKLEQRVYTAPRDARFEIASDGRVNAFDLGASGKKLDSDKAREILLLTVPRIFTADEDEETASLRIPIVPLTAKVISSAANDFGITALIGEGRSNFSGSSRDRVFNIRRALQDFQGRLIAPGEEFSFTDILGEVDGEHGYRPELVIRNNKTEPEFGGGICQVSTTLFRAAIYSGLEITARRNHSYPVKYYQPIGFDATVYVPRPDMRFRNNTPGYILIQSEIVDAELIFRIYGKDDGRTVAMDGPYITEKGDDGSLKTVFTQTVRDKDGNTFIKDIFKSAYDSPDKYPHPDDIDTSVKPKDWSKKQWKAYKQN